MAQLINEWANQENIADINGLSEVSYSIFFEVLQRGVEITHYYFYYYYYYYYHDHHHHHYHYYHHYSMLTFLTYK